MGPSTIHVYFISGNFPLYMFICPYTFIRDRRVSLVFGPILAQKIAIFVNFSRNRGIWGTRILGAYVRRPMLAESRLLQTLRASIFEALWPSGSKTNFLKDLIYINQDKKRKNILQHF